LNAASVGSPLRFSRFDFGSNSSVALLHSVAIFADWWNAGWASRFVTAAFAP
jgi:hypothetical protein